MRIFLLIFTFLIINSINAQTIRFMAGIERDLSASKQYEIVKRSLPGQNIILYKKGEYKRLIKDSYRDTSSIIILFSAGCKNSYSVIESVLCDVWIVEPHYSFAQNIRKCIDIGFPKERVVLGQSEGRGFGIAKGCRMTPKGLGHFSSLEWVCGIIRKSLK